MYRTTTHPGWQIGGTTFAAVAPLVLLPTIAYALFIDLPAWQLMWALAISIYLGLKWLTVASCLPSRRSSIAKTLGYLLLWPGMDAKAFLDSKSHAPRPAFGEWLLAMSKLAAGLVILYVVIPRMNSANAILQGWIGMIGLILVLHFGFFHVMSLCWRFNGVDAQPLMNFPIMSSSLSDFWGKRWNSAFRDLAFTQIFRPLVGKMGVAWATMAVFIVSGLVHDLVISVPVRGGWGGPTIYFVLQGVGLLVERSRLGRRLGFGRGFVGRLVCGLFTVGPVGLLFHEPFVRQAILPTLAAIRAI
jgi:hypothetical protein